jgi:hypothetical protein
METANEMAHGFETQILKTEKDNMYSIVDN